MLTVKMSAGGGVKKGVKLKARILMTSNARTDFGHKGSAKVTRRRAHEPTKPRLMNTGVSFGMWKDYFRIQRESTYAANQEVHPVFFDYRSSRALSSRNPHSSTQLLTSSR